MVDMVKVVSCTWRWGRWRIVMVEVDMLEVDVDMLEVEVGMVEVAMVEVVSYTSGDFTLLLE